MGTIINWYVGLWGYEYRSCENIKTAGSGPICRDFRMILKINLAAIFPSKNWSTILSKNSAYRPALYPENAWHLDPRFKSVICVFSCRVVYSNDPNTGCLNTQFIWIPDFLESGIQMVRLITWLGHLKTGLRHVFRCHLKTILKCLGFKW